MRDVVTDAMRKTLGLFAIAVLTAASVALVAVEASAAPVTGLVHAEGVYRGHGTLAGDTLTLALYPGHHHMGTFTDTRGDRGIWGTSGNGSSGNGITLASDPRTHGCEWIALMTLLPASLSTAARPGTYYSACGPTWGYVWLTKAPS